MLTCNPISAQEPYRPCLTAIEYAKCLAIFVAVPAHTQVAITGPPHIHKLPHSSSLHGTVLVLDNAFVGIPTCPPQTQNPWSEFVHRTSNSQLLTGVHEQCLGPYTRRIPKQVQHSSPKNSAKVTFMELKLRNGAAGCSCTLSSKS